MLRSQSPRPPRFNGEKIIRRFPPPRVTHYITRGWDGKARIRRLGKIRLATRLKPAPHDKRKPPRRAKPDVRNAGGWKTFDPPPAFFADETLGQPAVAG